MKFITGKNRQQVAVYTQCLDETVAQDNEIRLIDLFVDSLQLSDFGFAMVLLKTCLAGRQAADQLITLPIY